MTGLVYEGAKKEIDVDGAKLKYFDVSSVISSHKFNRLPFSIRVLLESAVRNCDNFQVSEEDVKNIVNWEENQGKDVEIRFRPARVILQDFTGVPAVVDFAAMRDAVARLGGDPTKINPICPVDLVIDHSVQVDVAGNKEALKKNEELEFVRNRERFQFLKWGSDAFEGLEIIPPGSGIVHQVNLEYLARVVFNKDATLFPDSLVGTDSHTTMINGLGVLGWGVGGIEAEAVPWIFYETAVFKKSRVRMEVYLKNTIHGFIALVALAASCFGYWAIYENKELIGKEHFTSYHGQIGVASLALIFVNQLLGAAAHYLKISAARKAHRMFSFLILSCFCGALSLGLWSGWADHNLHWILRYSGTTLATVPILMWL